MHAHAACMHAYTARQPGARYTALGGREGARYTALYSTQHTCCKRHTSGALHACSTLCPAQVAKDTTLGSCMLTALSLPGAGGQGRAPRAPRQARPGPRLRCRQARLTPARSAGPLGSASHCGPALGSQPAGAARRGAARPPPRGTWRGAARGPWAAGGAEGLWMGDGSGSGRRLATACRRPGGSSRQQQEAWRSAAGSSRKPAGGLEAAARRTRPRPARCTSRRRWASRRETAGGDGPAGGRRWASRRPAGGRLLAWLGAAAERAVVRGCGAGRRGLGGRRGHGPGPAAGRGPAGRHSPVCCPRPWVTFLQAVTPCGRHDSDGGPARPRRRAMEPLFFAAVEPQGACCWTQQTPQVDSRAGLARGPQGTASSREGPLEGCATAATDRKGPSRNSG
jgi:hypothetical protein